MAYLIQSATAFLVTLQCIQRLPCPLKAPEKKTTPAQVMKEGGALDRFHWKGSASDFKLSCWSDKVLKGAVQVRLFGQQFWVPLYGNVVSCSACSASAPKIVPKAFVYKLAAHSG